VVWVKANGELEVQPSVADSNRKLVTGTLSHFSQYALATPRDEYAAESEF
jgi:hypothetical protein